MKIKSSKLGNILFCLFSRCGLEGKLMVSKGKTLQGSE